jgi:hypothetical protein
MPWPMVRDPRKKRDSGLELSVVGKRLVRIHRCLSLFG